MSQPKQTIELCKHTAHAPLLLAEKLRSGSECDKGNAIFPIQRRSLKNGKGLGDCSGDNNPTQGRPRKESFWQDDPSRIASIVYVSYTTFYLNRILAITTKQETSVSKVIS